MLTITIPLPHRCLSPNARSHWATKARAVKKARTAALFSAIQAMQELPQYPYWTAATVQPHFYFRTKHKHDGDNCAASLKAALDGLADAGVVANDSAFTHLPPVLGVDAKNPRVELVVSPTTAPGDHPGS